MPKLTLHHEKGALPLIKSRKFVALQRENTNETLPSQVLSIKQLGRTNLNGFQLVVLHRKRTESLNTKLDEARQNTAVALGSHVYHTKHSTRPIIPTGDIFVRFEPNVLQQVQHRIFEALFLKIVEKQNENQYLVRITAKSPNPLKVAMRLQKRKEIALAEADVDVPLHQYDDFLMPQDTLIGHEWHLENRGSIPDNNTIEVLKPGADAKIGDAWRRLGNMGSPNLRIAFIDSGFDTSHPDLSANNINTLNLATGTSVIPQNLNGAIKENTHGTPCMGIALAAANNGGMVGVAPNSKSIIIHGLPSNAVAMQKAFRHCIDNQADIISCSWGISDFQEGMNAQKSSAIGDAAKNGRNGKGCIVLFAAGNHGGSEPDVINFYARHPDVICVAASTSTDEHASYSNTGNELWVCAPSDDGDGPNGFPVISTRVAWDAGNADIINGFTPDILAILTPEQVENYRFWCDGTSRGNRYKHFGGTSSATPLVAGVCALILSANPNLTALEVKNILRDTADKIGQASDYDSNGYSTKFGYGRVNADKAVQMALEG